MWSLGTYENLGKGRRHWNYRCDRKLFNETHLDVLEVQEGKLWQEFFVDLFQWWDHISR
jgi:hypothetical protein